MHDHTVKGMRSQSRPELIDRNMRSDWKAAGATSAYDRAMQKVKWILENPGNV